MSTHRPPRSRSVRFAQFSQLLLVPDGGGGGDRATYSPEDVARFQRDLVRAVGRMKRLLADSRGQASKTIAEDDLCECVGMEVFLVDGLAGHCAARRREHVRAVVCGQRVLGREDLKRLSEMSSRWARGRARKTATAFSKK